jgi:predicted RNA-binding protein YlxR (DUF448 family)/ribosomal protein L7Ae-like RNA K-turn-binding protein
MAPTKTAVRTCAGCREQRPREELVRLAVVPEPPYVVADARGRLGGRGVWVHADLECLRTAARKGGIARSLRRPVQLDPEVIAEGIRGQLERRLEGLLLGAHRARKVAVGTDAVRESLAEGRIRLLCVAEDAAGRRQELTAAAERLGKACAVLGPKAEVGRLFGRDEVAVLAIEDAGIAAEVNRASAHLAGLRSAGTFPHKERVGGPEETPADRQVEPVVEDQKRQ